MRNKRRSSYDAYLGWREEWEKKGYSLDTVMSKEQFEKNFEKAKKAGIKNIARTFAGQDRTFTKSEARALMDRMKTLTKEQQKAFKELFTSENRALNTRDFTSFKVEGGYGAGKTYREAVFDKLVALGLTEREAGEFLY